MTLTITLITIYVVSAYLTYRHTQLAHYHPKGRWRNINPNGMDIFETFLPVYNTIALIGWITHYPIVNSEGTNFFKPKQK